MTGFASPYDIIKEPVVTEKATDERMNHNKYTLYVDPRANKSQIKSAVETLFGVTVLSINTRSISGKTKRMGRFEGKTSRGKKAIMTLKQGDRIKLMEGP
jgi:large subunit ribosomal protein L23